ncbi:hypothetical protein ACFQPA_12605 [Halomarina halobia]|uniref:Amphi-Trp domain-containing protein n=1 Tax=Halomarina halobia TaxID=3033386 RepID=A0ABD6A9T2_9EURY|nr:hypothetical protein [Halomarina sp. PSR21]
MERNDDAVAEPAPADGARGSTSWLDVVDEVLDAAIDDEDELEATLSDLRIDVPLEMGPDAEHASWRFDGTVTVRTEGMRATLAEWLRWWDRDRRE